MEKGTDRRGQTKDCRRLIEEIEAAGGTVTATRRGHLQVRGPNGELAHLSGNFGSPRGWHKARNTLRLYAGIELRRGCEG